jgi:hypothetical protein
MNRDTQYLNRNEPTPQPKIPVTYSYYHLPCRNKKIHSYGNLFLTQIAAKKCIRKLIVMKKKL